MIRKFGLRDFKGHRDTELELGRFTLLVGDNASGKTSVLEALALQASAVRDPIAFLQHGSVEDLPRRGAEPMIALHASGPRISRADSQWKNAGAWSSKLQLTIGVTNTTRAAMDRELVFEGRADRIPSFSAWGSRNATEPRTVDGVSNSSDEWRSAAALIGTAAFCHLRAEAIAAAAYSDHPEIAIEADGTNTAVALAAMKLADDEAFQRVEDALCKVVPSVRRLRLRRAKVPHPLAGTDVIGSKIAFDFLGAVGVSADRASHGTLIVLALLTILHRANRPNLLLLDDFDHALHPRAQMEVVRMIKGLLALDEYRDLQIVATTHSPYMLDELDPSEIYAFALRDDGTVASRKLDEHPDSEKTRGSLKAGQLWSLDPERDWVLR